MIGYVVGRLKEENTKTRAYKIYFPETKQSWLMGVSELKKRYIDGTLPEIVGIKFSETANLNSIELTIIGVTGYYSTKRVAYCNHLEIVRLPRSLKELGPSAFKGCKKLRGLIISSSTPFELIQENLKDLGHSINGIKVVD